MKLTTLGVAALMMIGALDAAHAYDPKVTISDLDARLARIGVPKVDGTDKLGEKLVPALFYGDRKINRHYDIVDSIRRSHEATATIFVRDGNEFVRVSTNVLTPEGKRGIGTPLARNKAYDSISKGEQYCGLIEVLGTAFDACYNPIKDAAGKTIGATYIGHKK